MFYAWKSHISDDSALGRHASGVPWPDGLEARCPPDDLGEDPSYSALLLTQYLDYVRNCPGVFESLAGVFEVDLVVPQPSHGRDDIATTVPSVISDNSYVNISTCDSSGTAPHGSLSHPSSVPSLSNLGTSYAHDCVCTHCGKEFDRHTRARDCRNRDLGLTPHKCLGRCGVVGCTMSYGSEAVLLEHINPREMRCPWCSKVISKKNKARHQKKYCPDRNRLPSTSAAGAGREKTKVPERDQ